MASRRTLTADNLQALGAERLAALLMELSDGSATVKRRLRLELAGADGSADLSMEIRKRIATIARSRAVVGWQGRKALADDLETQRRMIVEQLAPKAPAEALELLWQFLDLARSVFARADDSSGVIQNVFYVAARDLGPVAEQARPDPRQLAERMASALSADSQGHFGDLVAVLKPVLGDIGLEHLKHRIHALSADPAAEAPPEEQPAAPLPGDRGSLTEAGLAARIKSGAFQSVLRAIADAQGDVDAYIGQYDEEARKAPRIAAGIAARLTAANRPAEALAMLDASTAPRRAGWPDFTWEDARIGALDALGRGEEAQAARRSCFERSLNAHYLREYLKRLAAFEDFEAEQRALEFAEGYRDALQAVMFLVSWPALDRAARVVEARAKDLNGDHYESLTPAAEKLAGKYPLAATLLLRAMIDFSLTASRSTRYGHAARHLRDCAGLATSITGFGAFETHDAYVARLGREHGRKASFWAAVGK